MLFTKIRASVGRMVEAWEEYNEFGFRPRVLVGLRETSMGPVRQVKSSEERRVLPIQIDRLSGAMSLD